MVASEPGGVAEKPVQKVRRPVGKTKVD